MLPPATPFGDAERVLDQELAVHHRHSPVAAAGDHLALLEAVAEEAELLAERIAVSGRRQAVEAGGRRAGHHALADAVGEPPWPGRRGEAEQQHADPRAAVGRLLGSELALDARLGVAGDHRGGVSRSASRAASCAQAGLSAVITIRARPHREGLGEGVDDLGVGEPHRPLPVRRWREPCERAPAARARARRSSRAAIAVDARRTSGRRVRLDRLRRTPRSTRRRSGRRAPRGARRPRRPPAPPLMTYRGVANISSRSSCSE